MITLTLAAFMFVAQPAIETPSRVTEARYRVRYYGRKKIRPRPRPIAPPSSSQAQVDEPEVKIVRVIPIIRAGATVWPLWLDRIDPVTDARARAAVRDALNPRSFDGVPK